MSMIDPLPVAAYEDHATVVLFERERAAAFCISGQGHRWTAESLGEYRCIECDLPSSGPPVGVLA